MMSSSSSAPGTRKVLVIRTIGKRLDVVRRTLPAARRGHAGGVLRARAVRGPGPDGEPRPLHPRLHTCGPDRDTVDHEPGPDLVVLGEQPVGVRDEDPAPAVRVARGDLAHRVALGP